MAIFKLLAMERFSNATSCTRLPGRDDWVYVEDYQARGAGCRFRRVELPDTVRGMYE
jgi:hypothetical protein